MQPTERNLPWRKMNRNILTDPRLHFIRRRIAPELRHKVFTVYLACFCTADDYGIIFISDLEYFSDYCDLDSCEELKTILDWLGKKEIIFDCTDEANTGKEEALQYEKVYQLFDWTIPYPDQKPAKTAAERQAEYRKRIQEQYRNDTDADAAKVLPPAPQNSPPKTGAAYVPPPSEGDAQAALDALKTQKAAEPENAPAAAPPPAVDFDKIRDFVVTTREEEIRGEKEKTERKRGKESESESESESEKNSEIPCSQVNDFAEPAVLPVQISGSEQESESAEFKQQFTLLLDYVCAAFCKKNTDFALNEQQKEAAGTLCLRFLELSSEKNPGGSLKNTPEVVASQFLSWFYIFLEQTDLEIPANYTPERLLQADFWKSIFIYVKMVLNPVTNIKSPWYKYEKLLE